MTETQDGNREPIRVLVLEDNLVDAELVIRQIRDDGLSIVPHVVSTELEFRREIADFSPQVILSDFSLPQFDGLSALQIARELVPATPFLFVSGTIGEQRAVEAMKRGAVDYVLKDSLARLVPAIRNAIKQSEVTRARDLAEEMLRRSESRLQDIVNTSADWIWECNAEGVFTFSSPSVSEILGYGHHEILGRASRELIGTRDGGALDRGFDRLRNERLPNVSVTLRWKHKDGAARWLERSMIALHGDSGELHGFRGIDRDVTTRVMQERRIKRLNRALRFLSGANSAIVHFRDRKKLLRETCRLAVQIGGYGMATVYLRVSDGSGSDVLTSRAVSKRLADRERPPEEPLDGTGPVASAIKTAEAVVVSDLSEGSFPDHHRELLLAMGLRSCIAVPLVMDGTAIGVIELHSDEINVFGDAELALLRQVTGNIAFSLQYLHNQESAQYLEYFDTLTALANRSLYLQRLGQMAQVAAQTSQSITLLVLDITGLTVVNDGMGHHAGDLLLQLVAERLKNAFRDSNCLCHLGGGRYAVAMLDSSEPDQSASALRARVERLFEEPFLISDQELCVSIKAGSAHYPDDGGEAESLLHHAQTALDHAKIAGERYLRHNLNMNIEASEKLSLTNQLRKLVAENGFILHYQPKLGTRSQMIEGVEALLRLPDSCIGPSSPAEFVPLLESLGLIEAVGRWVITQAMLETAAWFDTPKMPFRVAVNVSPLQLRREEFVDEVLGILENSPGDGHRLELEVTESMLMANPMRVGEMLSRLRSAGISIAIDDFGTGHSSLKVLSRLPVDVLKIDRSFVRDIRSNRSDRLIVQSTIALANSLGMTTVAEGVETQEQADLLTELGCDMLQGFFIKRPAPGEELERWLSASKSPNTGNGRIGYA